jgi:hypothetical protein
MTARSMLPALVVSLLVAVGCEDDPRRPEPSPDAAGAGGACEPMTCEDQGIDCGEIDDGCGEVLHCGDACGSGGQGGTAACTAVEPTTAPARTARRARSVGFSGTSDAYSELFTIACEDASECTTACEERGGEEAMCAASECLPNGAGSSDCVPAPIWDNLASIQVEDAALEEMTQIVLVSTPYSDVMIVDQFELEVPEDATVLGLTVEILRAGDENVADDSVKVVKGGQIGDAERALPDAWTTELGWVTYGGDDDLWGETWTPADLNAEDFGVAISAVYALPAGNTRAYVDQVRLTVHYSVTCE